MNKPSHPIVGLTGHLIDLYRIAGFNFNNPHSYTKFRSINSLRKKTGAKNFIETGTYLGITASRCAKVFERVYTIELDDKLAKKSVDYLKNHKNVQVIQGDGLEVCLELLKNGSIDNILIFLDGHFSGGVTACGDLPEPAVEELKLLANYREKIRAIIVDDFRAFGTEPGFPTKSDLLKSAEDYFGIHGYEIAVYLDQLLISCKG